MICTKCRKDLPPNNFHKHKKYKGGLRTQCKECVHSYWLSVRDRYIHKVRYRYNHDKEFKEKEVLRKKEWIKNNYERYRKNYNKRNPNTKKLRERFLVFQRDSFTCSYCGAKPPEVVLQVDHILPKSKGGENEMGNYTTSCSLCNLGKGDVLLTKNKQ